LVYQSILQLINVCKSFSNTQAVNSVSFDVTEGEIVALLGPSGSGKSTVLMIISGLEKLDHGDVLWKGTSILLKAPHQRGFGLMFQDFVLFPHMNVFDNISFGLRMIDLNRDQVNKRVGEMLELVGLPGFATRDVHTLSGGEQQRVALARALAPAPRLLMLDEPLGSVDRTLRERLMVEVRHILRQMGQTAIYVTHDQEEAFAIADRVVVMREGKVEQIGAPQEIYRLPTSLFMARFLGFINLLPADILDKDGQRIMHTPFGSLPVNDLRQGKVTILLRPDAVYLDERGEYKLQGRVVEISFRGNISRTIISVDGTNLQFDFPSQVALPREGEQVVFSFNINEAIQVFNNDGS
jgi:ABC-type Fe3+/spermidine/putrescine transport system ATPase subunit